MTRPIINTNRRQYKPKFGVTICRPCGTNPSSIGGSWGGGSLLLPTLLPLLPSSGKGRPATPGAAAVGRATRTGLVDSDWHTTLSQYNVKATRARPRINKLWTDAVDKQAHEAVEKLYTLTGSRCLPSSLMGTAGIISSSSSSSSSSYLCLINFVKMQSNTINEVSGVNSTNKRHDNDCRETASTCLCTDNTDNKVRVSKMTNFVYK